MDRATAKVMDRRGPVRGRQGVVVDTIQEVVMVHQVVGMARVMVLLRIRKLGTVVPAEHMVGMVTVTAVLLQHLRLVAAVTLTIMQDTTVRDTTMVDQVAVIATPITVTPDTRVGMVMDPPPLMGRTVILLVLMHLLHLQVAK